VFGRDDLDIVDPDSYLQGFPHATFKRLRDEDPISWWDEHDGGKGFWAVTRYDDLLSVSRQVEIFSSAQGITLEEMDPEDFRLRRNMLEYDPPEHTRYRRLVSKPFARREVYAYENAIRLLARRWSRRPSPDRRRSTSSRTWRSSCRCACSAACSACPTRTARGSSKRGDALIGNFDPEMTTHALGLTDTDEFKHIPFRSPAALDLYQYAERAAAERRAHPTDDVISKLLAPTIDGEQLTELEFKNFFVLMVSAGNDTTRYSMAAAMKALIDHP
jgi:cytochrome P450